MLGYESSPIIYICITLEYLIKSFSLASQYCIIAKPGNKYRAALLTSLKATSN